MNSNVRELRLLREFRERLSLNLNGLVVATEAGSGPFLYSALAAAMAGAKKVIAVAPDSPYATHAEISAAIDERVSAWNIPEGCLSVVKSRDDIPPGVDIFLNLGFIRPLDASVLSRGSAGAVVSYMCESWEFRPGDLDVDYCRAHSIPVAGVNEDYDGFGVFESCGQLAIKLLFEAGVEVAGCRIGVVSDDPFGDVIERVLISNSADVFRIRDISLLGLDNVASLDALFIASYSDSGNVLEDLSFSLESLVLFNSGIKVIQFAGVCDVSALIQAGLEVYPAEQLLPFRMSRTLSYLGSRPVLALHSLGLKVGELLYNDKLKRDFDAAEWSDLVQRMV